MDNPTPILCIAIPTPLSRSFDYLLSAHDFATRQPDELVGCRVEVSFGRSHCIGVVLGWREKSTVPPGKLKTVKRILDTTPVLSANVLRLIHWASQYYHYPIGEVVAVALPNALRRNKPAKEKSAKSIPAAWKLSKAGQSLPIDTLNSVLGNAPLQQKIFEALRHTPYTDRVHLASLGSSWRNSVKRLCQAGWVEPCEASEEAVLNSPEIVPDPGANHRAVPVLNEAQQTALKRLQQSGDHYTPYLLDGVTGSGKTEIYLRYSAQKITEGRQVLVIVPEIGLTPQLVSRFKSRFGSAVVALHSGLNDTERLRNWRLAANGGAAVVIGTRSSVFVAFDSLGLIIIDEEHDGSLKQQDGFRYHARDLALVRARDEDIPVILGSATPSLETLHNAQTGKYQHLLLTQRAGKASAPTISLLDVRRAPLNEGLSAPLIKQMQVHLDRGNQVMLFLNRRGYAPVMLCDDCSRTLDCLRCDAHMTVHIGNKRLRCHHCGAERPVPSVCGHCGARALVMAGQGTERVDYALRAVFPHRSIVRIDRDTTRRKGALQNHLDMVNSGEANILIGTQMLAKGHHFPGVTMVAMLDVDRGFFGVDFRAAEQMAQTIVQVAGRAGRVAQAGEVLIQTSKPDNPLFQTLIHQGYTAFAKTLLTERQVVGLPPYQCLALLRAEASAESSALHFLRTMKQWIAQHDRPQRQVPVQVLGPAAAPIERVAGRYRAQLLLSSPSRKSLHNLLAVLRPALETLPESRKVRWSLDIDPIDLM